MRFLHSKIVLYCLLNLNFKGCLICEKINASVFINKNVENESSEAALSDVKDLHIGQEILIKIKSVKYEQNNLFITASYVKSFLEE